MTTTDEAARAISTRTLAEHLVPNVTYPTALVPELQCWYAYVQV